MAIARRTAIESVRVIFMERDATQFVVATLRAEISVNVLYCYLAAEMDPARLTCVL